MNAYFMRNSNGRRAAASNSASHSAGMGVGSPGSIVIILIDTDGCLDIDRRIMSIAVDNDCRYIAGAVVGADLSRPVSLIQSRKRSGHSLTGRPVGRVPQPWAPPA